MYLAIIADIHDNLANLDKILRWSAGNRIEKIICLGDITTTETISHLAANFAGEIFVVLGNCELYQTTVFSSFPNLTYLGTEKNITLGGLLIGCCHESENINRLISATGLKTGDPDFVFYGHTHKPWLKKRGRVIIANPGNVAGVFHQATFATLETNNRQLELKILATLA
ncbi:MAG: YfcE family phosphodiesterase [Patescibacteria group bacterium]|jgi:putative phosphoesterase